MHNSCLITLGEEGAKIKFLTVENNLEPPPCFKKDCNMSFLSFLFDSAHGDSMSLLHGILLIYQVASIERKVRVCVHWI